MSGATRTGTLRCCSMCSYCSNQLLNHVLKIHRHDPNFHVYCATCLRSYQTLSSFRKHISRGCVQQVLECTANGESDGSAEVEDEHLYNEEGVV